MGVRLFVDTEIMY